MSAVCAAGALTRRCCSRTRRILVAAVAPPRFMCPCVAERQVVGRKHGGRRLKTIALRTCVSLALGLLCSGLAWGQTVGPKNGALILSGAGEPHGDPAVLRRFVELAGGAASEIIYIPTAASGIRLPSGFVAELSDSGDIARVPLSRNTARPCAGSGTPARGCGGRELRGRDHPGFVRAAWTT